MRIALISTPFVRVPPIGYGGTELFCYELAEELHARGHDVTLFTTGDSETSCSKRFIFARPEWPPTPFDEVVHLAWAFSEIARGCFDVAHVNNSLGVPFARFLGLPVVHTLHHHRVDAISRLYGENPFVHYVAISRRQLEIEVPLAQSSVIHHGLSPSRYPASVRDEGYLLHLGRFAPEKGTHVAIDVARAAGLPLKIAGRTHPQDKEYFESQVAPRLRYPSVQEVGEVDHEAKLFLLRGARALLCPLQWEEPFGLAAVEAMLCGTPVIGFPRGSFPEIVDETVTGFLAPNDDVPAMARLARSLDGFDRVGCARRARERFSTSVMTAAYEALYTRLAGS